MAFIGMVNLKKGIVEIPKEKICCDCGSTKKVEDFHKKKESLDGRDPRCKECRRRTYEEKKVKEERYPFDWIY